jgi:hypothetical protein
MPPGDQITFQRVLAASRGEGRFYGWIILAMLGVTSGILTMTGPYLTREGVYFSNGGLFGLALSAYFFLCRGYRAFSYAILLVMLSVMAYVLATSGAMFSALLFRESSSETPIASLFVGGVIGGFLLLNSVQFLYRSPNVRGSLLVFRAAIWSLASGVLGAVGWALGPSLGKALWSILPNAALPSPDAFNQYALYFVWQPVMALLIGYLVKSEYRASVAAAIPQSAGNAPLDGEHFLLTQRTFLTVVALLLAIIVVRAVPIRGRLTKREAGQARMTAEVPSMENLPFIQPMTVDEALINAPIVGYASHQAMCGQQMVSHEKGFLQPGAIYCQVAYYPEGDPRPYQNSVSVSVQRYPNAEWASYLVEFPHNVYNPHDDPKVHATVTRFQNKVRTDFFNRPANTAFGYYMWPSGSNVVTLRYYMQDEKVDFLRLYLEKYPSSIR